MTNVYYYYRVRDDEGCTCTTLCTLVTILWYGHFEKINILYYSHFQFIFIPYKVVAISITISIIYCHRTLYSPRSIITNLRSPYKVSVIKKRLRCPFTDGETAGPQYTEFDGGGAAVVFHNTRGV